MNPQSTVVEAARPLAPHQHPGRKEPGRGPGALLRRAPLVSFFVLAFALSWLAWTPYILSHNGIGAWNVTFPGGDLGSQLLGVLPGAYLGPIASALTVTVACEGREGLRSSARRMMRFKVGWFWYLVVVVSVPAALTLATTALTEQSPVMPSAAVLAAFLPGLVLQMITTGLAEEPGWREFAMPRMQRRYGPLLATVVVGVLWGAWHLPLFLTDWGGPAHGITPVAEFMATTLAFSFVMTWVFNRTGESMPLVMLTHTSVNNFISTAWSDMFPHTDAAYGSHAFLVSSFAAALIILVATRGRLGTGRATPLR